MVNENNDLNIDDFKVPVSDDKGHNVHLTFRCIPSWSGHMDRIVKLGGFPYTNRGDLIRHALMRHFHWLEGIAEVPNSILSQIQMMTDLIEDDKRQQGFEQIIEGLQERVSYHMNNGDLGQARRHILQALECVEEMPGGFWRDKFHRELKRAHGRILDTAPKAKLGKIKEEEEEEAA